MKLQTAELRLNQRLRTDVCGVDTHPPSQTLVYSPWFYPSSAVSSFFIHRECKPGYLYICLADISMLHTSAADIPLVRTGVSAFIQVILHLSS